MQGVWFRNGLYSSAYSNQITSFKAFLAPLFAVTLAIQVGYAFQKRVISSTETPIEFSFSPGIEAEVLVVKVIASAAVYARTPTEQAAKSTAAALNKANRKAPVQI